MWGQPNQSCQLLPLKPHFESAPNFSDGRWPDGLTAGEADREVEVPAVLQVLLCGPQVDKETTEKMVVEPSRIGMFIGIYIRITSNFYDFGCVRNMRMNHIIMTFGTLVVYAIFKETKFTMIIMAKLKNNLNGLSLIKHWQVNLCGWVSSFFLWVYHVSEGDEYPASERLMWTFPGILGFWSGKT